MTSTGINQVNRKIKTKQLVSVLGPVAALHHLGSAIPTNKVNKKLLLVGITAVLCGITVTALRHSPLDIASGITFDSEVLHSQIARTGVWGVVGLFIFQVLQMIIPIIPGLPLQIASGYSYGFLWGILLNLLSAMVGGQIAFGLARRLGRPMVSRHVPENALNRCAQIMERGGVVFLALAYMIPFFPAEVMNFVAGFAPIRGRRFFIVTLIGRLPLVVLATLIGSHGLEFPDATNFWN